MRKIKVVVLLVRQLQQGFTKNAKVSPNLTVTQMLQHGCDAGTCLVWSAVAQLVECRTRNRESPGSNPL